VFEGVCEGEIVESETGVGGFGYDSIFRPTGFAGTFAEMDPQRKNRISHRGMAFRKASAFLRERFASTS
jgi:XTP/dITP diphosphohydrolase